jgi:antitoxin (DNA-binding transcriptional repressor) of toxin-antitoxin stability system
MKTVNIHEAKTHLSRLDDRAADGKAFIIAKAGRPMVMVVPPATDPAPAPRRFGFLAGQITVPDDFDRIGEDAIAAVFGIDRSGFSSTPVCCCWRPRTMPGSRSPPGP